MDLFYASVGTAMEVTGGSTPQSTASFWTLPLATMAAASYYSMVGPRRRATEAVSSSSQQLIQNTWGMVSLPSIKFLSLRVSQLLKGAALAERINIDGVPCFILSKAACPGKAQYVRA